MAEIVDTTSVALWPKGSNGRGVHVACDHYDDGGVVFRSPQNQNEWFAQVGPNNDYTLYPQNFQDHANSVGQPNFTTEEIESFMYTKGTRNAGVGGDFNAVRARYIIDNMGPGKEFTAEQVGRLAANGVPGLPGIGAHAGQISTAEVDSNGIMKWRPASPQTSPDPNTSPGGAPGGDQTIQPIPYVPPAMVDGRQVAGERATLRYPQKEPPAALGYDYIKITAYKYQPPGLEMVGNNLSGYGPDFRISGEPFETVILPMQPNITESNSTSWNEDQMNAIEAAAGTLAMGGIKATAELFLGNWGGAKNEIGSAFGSIGNQIKSVMTDPATKAGIISYFAGQAIGKNIMGRQTGQVINPNMELLFNGPRLRTFNFNFTFTPRFKEEAQIIRKIIRAFKRNMAPQRSTSNLFLLSPRVFKLKYIYNNRAEEDDDGDGSQHPYMDTFKTCALTAFNVDYTPGGSYATYRDGGSMTQYKVTMSFNELNPIYADEYKLDTLHMGYG